MAPKPKTQRTPPPTQQVAAETLARKARDKADDDTNTARVMTNGQCNTVVVQQYLSYFNGGSNVHALSEVSMEQARSIGGGDFSSLELMLLTQATALQAMFVDLATRAKRQDRFDGVQTLTTLALKCAAQSRQAVTALAELRMPNTVMFAKQANVTSGPQQVNNGVASQDSPARAEGIQSGPNELSGATHGLLQDTRTSCPAIGTNPHLAAMGEVHWAEVPHR
jgi:hypothetical protein